MQRTNGRYFSTRDLELRRALAEHKAKTGIDEQIGANSLLKKALEKVLAARSATTADARAKVYSQLKKQLEAKFEDPEERQTQLSRLEATIDIFERNASQKGFISMSPNENTAKTTSSKETGQSSGARALVIIALVVALGAGGFYAWQNSQNNVDVAEAPTNDAPVAEETVATIEVAEELVFKLTSEANLRSASDHSFTYEDGVLVARSEGAAPRSSGNTNSVFITLPSEFEQSVSGETIRIAVRATPTNDRPSSEFAIAYSTARVGNSGWQRFVLDQATGTTFTFDYAVPAHPTDRAPEADFLGIWADTSGRGGGVQITSIEIGLVDE
ncbi:MAG: hypothetical protein AAGG69_00105 [Pseudomonadota bacterium]